MMSKLIQATPLAIALFFVVFRRLSNWCIDVLGTCYGTWIHHIALDLIKPLGIYSYISLPLLIIVIFLPRQVFVTWLRFAIGWLVLSGLFVWGFDDNGSIPGIDEIQMTWFFAEAFTVLSLIVIGVKYLRLRKSR